MDQQELIERLIRWTLLVVSLSVHEWAHAWSAYKLGDDTAARMGRLTFNPLVHIDLVGTVILPLLNAPIGWAKPVPVQPHRFDRKYSPAFGMLLTAIAGPISNIVLAVIGTLIFAGATHFRFSHPEAFEATIVILIQFILMNIALAVFNMIPIPPLDGSRVANYFMPYSLRPAWEQIEEFSMYILIGVFVMLRYSETNILSGPVEWIFSWLLFLARPLMG
ncbi:Peptidase family M50 [Caulifigura coniformis]|uniref:Peptidase family M50 n=1 Tax=Caulifigura coniformis TaxID=2527983 RepID=A0A517SMQ6_9PLAN|nr:site-2 protease family protein [Caulifigura coniformis]QDT57412.1 Peptidase family M50 [Caulifigura coniformis]